MAVEALLKSYTLPLPERATILPRSPDIQTDWGVSGPVGAAGPLHEGMHHLDLNQDGDVEPTTGR
jgi:hypothetical protein